MRVKAPPDDLMPGQKAPAYLSCAYEYFEEENVYCSRDHFNVTLDIRRRVIERTSHYVYDEHIRVGDLMLLWGQPTGFRRWFHVYAVYWSDRYCYAIGRTGFSPYSEVVVLVWGKSDEMLKWQGFTKGE